MKLTTVANTVVPITSTTERAYARLISWDISTIKQYAVQKGLYTAEEINAVENEYKKYLALCAGFPTESHLTPRVIDDLWHTHILFTQDYAAMCESVAGRFLHHSPFVDGQKAPKGSKRKLRARYIAAFGVPPKWSGVSTCDKPAGSPGETCTGSGCMNNGITAFVDKKATGHPVHASP